MVFGRLLFFIGGCRLRPISRPFGVFSNVGLDFIRCCKKIGVRRYAFDHWIGSLYCRIGTFEKASDEVCLMFLLLLDDGLIVFFADEHGW